MHSRSIFTAALFLSQSLVHAQQLQPDFAALRDSTRHTIATASSALNNLDLERLVATGLASRLVLGSSKLGHAVEAYYFPGTGKGRVLVIGGMHGSELASIDMARLLISQLQNGETPSNHVMIIPVLFPDNAEKALVHNDCRVNYGRYTSDQHPDPNRQMPAAGSSFLESDPRDALGRTIEAENSYLLSLIQQFRPSGIVNLHAINDVSKAGIYADPRTDCNGLALGFHSDETLALQMARLIHEHGGQVPGNNLSTIPTALYYKDPTPAHEGFYQKRKLNGSALPMKRGSGTSLGTWATTAVCDGIANREAMKLITVEFPGYKSYRQCTHEKEREQRFRNVYLYTMAITRIFLEHDFQK